MRAWALSAIVLLAAAIGVRSSARAPGVYDPDPQHLWNRLHDALFVRVGNDGVEYGRDRIEPLLWRRSTHLLSGDSHQRLLTVLTEFNKGGERLIGDRVKRAMLQRDLWLVFSWLESGHDEFSGYGGPPGKWQARQEALRGPLAQAIGRLALPAAEIAALPDTYQNALRSRAFATGFDPAAPDQVFLPKDLYAPAGPWVSLGRANDLIARAHVLSDNPFTNSAFLVFINLPGGREATIEYMTRLTAFAGPLFQPGAEAVFPNYNPAIPQFPAGTQVVLVRRALLVTANHDVMASPLAENVQVRVYRRVPSSHPDLGSFLSTSDGSQSAFEFLLSRTRLFAGESGGLDAISDHDFLTGFSTHGIDPFDPSPGKAPEITARRPGPVGRSAPARSTANAVCFACHFLPGVFSFNTFVQNFGTSQPGGPRPPSAAPVEDVLAASVAWKRRQNDWLLLKRLLAR